MSVFVHLFHFLYERDAWMRSHPSSQRFVPFIRIFSLGGKKKPLKTAKKEKKEVGHILAFTIVEIRSKPLLFSHG
jgi:hypothetical protein